MKGKRGSSLAGVLVLSVTAVGLLFVVSGNWILQNGLASRPLASDGARRLAESAVHSAVARLQQKPALSTAELPGVNITLPAYDGGVGLLALEPGRSRTWDVPLSVNNLAGDKGVSGWGDTVVAKETANLVAVGRFHGAEYRCEVVLYVPAFPYVVASDVPLKAVGGLSVFGLKQLNALSAGFAAIPEEMKRPGHISTNASDHNGEPSLQLLGSTHIEGDAQSHGTVVTADAHTVKGEIRNFANTQPLPTIDIKKLDTAGKPGMSQLTSSTMDSPTLSGFNRSRNLTVSGGLKLDNSVIYVDGNLTIRGGVRGVGAIIASGNVTIEGGSALSGDNQTAILAHGSVTLRGTAGERSEFRGMVYSEGNLDCKYANIAGPIVVNNPDPDGQVTMQEVALAEVSQLASQSVDVVVPAQAAAQGPADVNAVLDQNNPNLPRDANGNVVVSDDMLANPLSYTVPTVNPGDLPPEAYQQLAADARDRMQGWVDQTNNSPGTPLDPALSQVDPGADPIGAGPGSSGGSGPGVVKWTLDLDQFTQLSDRIRILSWRRL
ncbi:MAG: hypothetical protein U0931_00410 [Vulcanimicrobiota bacterium]